MEERDISDNKMKAFREKERAESLIAKKEYQDARDKILKAQQLFPGLDHIDAMRSVCEILSAATCLGDTVDYYWVLQVGPLSPLSSIRERYRKLRTMLQPIKFKFLGTDLALQLIQDAFTVLGDEVKRLAFDSQKNNILENFESPFLEMSSDQSMPCQDIRAVRPDRIDSVEFSGEMHDNITTGNIEQNAAGGTNTDVVAISPLQNIEDELRSLIPDAQGMLAQDFYDFDSDRTLDNIKLGQIWAVHHQSNMVQNYRNAQIVANSNFAVGVVWLRPVPVSDEERRWCEARLPMACGSFCLDIEAGEQVCSPLVFSYKCSCVPGEWFNQFDIYPKKGEVWVLYEDCELNEWSHNPEVVKSWNFKLIKLLSDFSKYMGADCAYLEKVEGFRSIFQRQNKEAFSVNFHISPRTLYRLSHNVPAYRLTGREINGVTEGMLELDLSALPHSMIQDMENKITVEDDIAISYDFTYSAKPSLLMPSIDNNVSGPNIWSDGVSVSQVWAVYSGTDSMPRQYTRIDNVISATQVRVTFLELQPITDYEINWKNKKLPVVCGVLVEALSVLEHLSYLISSAVR